MSKETNGKDAETVDVVEVAPVKPDSLAVMPIMDVKQAVERYKAMTTFVQEIMKEDIDYGKIPGTGDKPVLLKPGAEKLTTFFGLTVRFSDERVVEDDSDPKHPYFFYRRKCQLYRGDRLVGEGSGSCNSREAKYRWRVAQKVCPECGEELRRSKREGEGWYCWTKTGGCGANFDLDNEDIAKQETGKVENPNIADLANTILKMADKRALVAATLITCNASEFFTQDLEDMALNGDKVPSNDEGSTPVGSGTPGKKPGGKVVNAPKHANGKEDDRHWAETDEGKAWLAGLLEKRALELSEVITALDAATDYEVKELRDFRGDTEMAFAIIEKHDFAKSEKA